MGKKLKYALTGAALLAAAKGIDRLNIHRFSNPDGTLSEKGKKHYANIKNEKRQYRGLKKQMQERCARMYGASNRWGRGALGDNSQKVYDQYDKNEAAYRNSQEYKDWIKALEKAERYDEAHPSDDGTYMYNKVCEKKPPKNFTPDLQWAYVYGEGYKNDYVNKGGKILSIAKLKDMGYDENTAKKITKRLALKGKTLGT